MGYLLFKFLAVQRILFVSMAFFFYSSLMGQQLRRPIAARYIGIGAYSRNFTDVFSFTANQASLARLKSGAMGIYSERRFLLEELNLYSAAVAIPSRQGGFGLQADYFGFSAFNEYRLGLAYGRSLGDKVDLGLQVNYQGLRIPVYGNAATVNAEIGLLLRVTDKITAGVHAFNPVGGKLGKDGSEKIASVYKAGLGYEASSRLLVTAEVVKEEEEPVNVNASLHYQFHDKFFARLGVATETTSSFAGVGMLFKNFRLDLSAGYHPQLGLSPGLVLIYRFKQQD